MSEQDAPTAGGDQDAFESHDSLHANAARFLIALRDDDTSRALAILRETPSLATYSIHTAAAVGDADTVQAMLGDNSELANALASGEQVPLIVYAASDDIKRALGVSVETQLATVRALLDAGASPNASVPLPDVSDTIPVLYFPCTSGNVPVARLLLERGANPTDGESLYHAAQHDHRDCLALLVEYGADLDRGPAKYGNTPLHFLAAHGPDNHITPRALRGMEWLLERGADPNITSYAGRANNPQAGETPLHRAAAIGHDAAVLKLLVDHGANVNVARDDGATAYQLAMRSGNTVSATYLESVGADTTLRDIDRLLHACLTNDATRAREMIARDPSLMTSLEPADRDALGFAFGFALSQKNLDAVRLMLALGWPLTHEGEWGGTPLHWAAWNGEVDVVRLLLEHGAPVNVRDSRYGSSPIAWCAHGSRFNERGNDEEYPAIVHLLIDAGATRSESYNSWNESPESMARPSVARAMRERGFAE